MDKLTIISGCLFLAADIFAIASLANPDWINTGESAGGGDILPSVKCIKTDICGERGCRGNGGVPFHVMKVNKITVCLQCDVSMCLAGAGELGQVKMALFESNSETQGLSAIASKAASCDSFRLLQWNIGERSTQMYSIIHSDFYEDSKVCVDTVKIPKGCCRGTKGEGKIGKNDQAGGISSGALTVGLVRQCQTIHGRDRTCIPPRLPPEWVTTLFFIIMGIISLTVTCGLLVASHWRREATKYARWIAFTGSKCACLQAKQ
ncbi:hypothetical protein EYD10_10680, partial [Varanus komodoensis]